MAKNTKCIRSIAEEKKKVIIKIKKAVYFLILDHRKNYWYGC